MTQTPNPHPDSQTIIDRARKAGAKFAHALTANDARWVVGWSVALVLVDLVASLLARVAPSLLPTVLTLAIALLLGAQTVIAVVPERLPEVRRALRITAFGLLIGAVALTIVLASASSQQQRQATSRCLATAAHIATPPAASLRHHWLTSDLAALGRALCDQLAAERS